MAGMHELLALGQSVWLDFISRSLVRGGQLKHLVDHGLRGLTSNPSIFEKAIASGNEYDDEMQAILRRDPDCETTELFEQLAITDIREAADVLRSVYDASRGQDGFVSLEVSPHLAHEPDATIAEAKRLWHAVNRPNLMIKVPATPASMSTPPSCSRSIITRPSLAPTCSGCSVPPIHHASLLSRPSS